MYLSPLTIGPLKLAGNIFAAPMAGYSDKATRQLALEYGANLAFTEMVSCEGLWRLSAKTQPIMERADGEENLAMQLFAGNVEALEKALPIALTQKPQLIDFNCGCPVNKVIKSGSGSALMQNSALFKELMHTLRQNVPADIAVSVKFRSGWNFDSINYLQIAELALNEGINLITLHPRTRSQAYSGKADYNHLATLKKTFPQAIICGSGDLYTIEDVTKMFEQTGIDAVMIARGSIGNPFIYKQITEAAAGRTYNPTANERYATALKHFELALEYGNEGTVVREIKKHILAYPKGIAGCAAFKGVFAPLLNKEEMLTLLKNTLATV
ncbi:MAG: tRNA-dihydrouridine synthase [Spirochaetaceae bacterium]|nr:tRNA-dihydrouridine synthase [Spirochaetaceae bacterium]